MLSVGLPASRAVSGAGRGLGCCLGVLSRSLSSWQGGAPQEGLGSPGRQLPAAQSSVSWSWRDQLCGGAKLTQLLVAFGKALPFPVPWNPGLQGAQLPSG